MSYEQASREAARLLERPGWYVSFDRLTELHAIISRHVEEALAAGHFDLIPQHAWRPEWPEQ